MTILSGTANPVLAAGCRPDITVVATHGVFTAQAAETMRALPIGRIVTTDSVTPPGDLGLPVEIVPVAPLLAGVIGRLDRDESLGDLVSHG